VQKSHQGLTAVSDDDCLILADALAVLFKERACALRLAAAIATARGERVPDAHDFGLTQILRLSRAIGSDVPPLSDFWPVAKSST